MKVDQSKAGLPENILRLVESYAYDIVQWVTRGPAIQKKHFLLGQGLHNLSGSRKLVDIIYKLKNCISYNLACEIESAQAEAVLTGSIDGAMLPVKPTLPD